MSQKYVGGLITANQNSNYSGLFNGSANYLSLAGAAQYAIATSTTPFTVEAWIRPTAPGSVIFTEEYGVPTIAIACGLVTSNDMGSIAGLYPAFGWFSGGWTTAAVSSVPVALNIWTHVAFVFTGSTSKVYINGVDVTKPSSPTPATTWGVTATNGTTWFIGRRWDTTATNLYYKGYISNLRFVNGTAVYTANFAPPARLSAIANTVLLTCQSATLIDNSSYAATITNNGSTISTTANPFYTQSTPALGAATPGVWTLNQATKAIATRSWNMYDPYILNIPTIVHGTGTNGSNNDTFLDSSNNNFPVTRNGNVTQGSFSPFSEPDGYWSTYFGGSGNYVVTNAAAFSTTETTFTIEGWVYLATTPTGANPAIVGDMQPASTANNWSFGVPSTLRLTFYWWIGSARSAVGSTVFALNTWYHIAVSVNSNAITMYVNGVQETLTGTTTLSTRSSTTSTIALGQAQTASMIFTGYVSNLSILAGTAKYSGNFTVPTPPLPTGANNQVFLFGGNNRLYDANTATTAKTLTITGSIRSVPYSPVYPRYAYSQEVNGGGMFFDGTGDYLTVSGDSNLAFGTNDFTIELFLYITSFPAQEVIYDARPSGTNGAYPCIYLSGSTSKFSYFVSSANRIVSDNNYVFNSWTHLVVSRVSGTTRMFVNGVVQTQTWSDTTTYLNGTDRPAIGCAGDTIGNAPWFGYISNVRVLNGTGFTSVTVPTAPFTKNSSANTQLLLSCTNAAIFDNASSFLIDTVNTTISTAQNKYGSGSISFNGSSSYARLITASAVSSSSYGANAVPVRGDFTIEAWVNPTSTAAAGTIFYINGGTNQYAGIRLDHTATGTLQLLASTSGTTWAYNLTSTITISTGVWSHLAVVRAGPSITLYLNGVSIGSGTGVSLTTALIAGTVSLLGAYFNVSYLQYFNGYMSDFRMTNYARYMGNFTPPTSTIQNQ